MALPNTGLDLILKDDTETGETGADKINAIMDYLEVNKISMQGFMDPNATNGGFVGKQMINGSADFREGDYVIVLSNGEYDFATGAAAAPGSGTKLEQGDRYAFITGQWIPTQPPRSRNKGWFNPMVAGGGLPGTESIINGTHEYKNGDYLIANKSSGYDFDNGVRDPNGEEVKTSDRIAYDGTTWFVLKASLGLMQGWFDPNIDGGGLALKEAVTDSASTYVYGEYVIAGTTGKYDFATGMTGTAASVQIDVGTIIRWEGSKWDIMRSLNDNPNKGFAKLDVDGGDVHPAIQNGGGYNEGDFFIALVGGLYDFNSGTTELNPTPRTTDVAKGDVIRMGAGDLWELVSEPVTGGGAVPTGTIIMFPTLAPPTGFLLCNGAAVSASFPKLIGLVGATLPDMRDQFVRGASTQTQIDGFTKYKFTTGHPKTAFNVDAGGAHSHSTRSAGDHWHKEGISAYKPQVYPANRIVENGGQSPDGGQGSGRIRFKTDNAGVHSHVISTQANHTHGFSGGDAETAPDHVRMAYMIKHD